MSAGTSLFTLLSSSQMIGIPENATDVIVEHCSDKAKFLAMIGMNNLLTPCTSTIHLYHERADKYARTTLASSCSAAETSLVFTDAVFSVGEVVNIGLETILIGGTTSDKKAFTSCSRSHYTGAASAHSSGDMAVSLGDPRAQGRSAGTTSDLIRHPAQVTTYTQIFSKDVVISGTAEALHRYGINDELDEAVRQALLTIALEMQQAIFMGDAVAPSTTSTAGQFDGLYERMAAKSLNTALGGAKVTIDNLEDAVQNISDYDSTSNLIVCGLYEKRVLNAWGSDVIRQARPDEAVYQMFGNSVSKLLIGDTEHDVLVLPQFDSMLWVLTKENIHFGPLQGRSLHAKPIAPQGDFFNTMVLAEMTAELPAVESHWVFTGAATS